MRLAFVVAAVFFLISSLHAEVTLLAHWDESPHPDFVAESKSVTVTNATLTEDGQGLPFKGAGPHRALRFTKDTHFDIPLEYRKSPGTFSVWFRPAALDSAPYILSFGYPGPIELRFRRFKKKGLTLFLVIYVASRKAEQLIAPVPEFKANTWMHITMTWDFAVGRYAVYLNGREMIKARDVGYRNKRVLVPFVFLGRLWNDEKFPCAQGDFDELVLESGELTAAVVAQRYEAMSKGQRIDYPIDIGKLKQKLSDNVSEIKGLLRAADYLKLDVTEARKVFEDCQRMLASQQWVASASPAKVPRLQPAAVQAEETKAGLRTRIVKHLNEAPLVTMPLSTDWLDTLRPCEAGKFATKPPAEAALDLFLEGFNAYITLEGGTQFTYNPPNAQVLAKKIQPLKPPNKALFAKITEMCHKLGIRVILHSTSGFMDRRVLDEHPAWSVVDVRTGKPAVTTGAYGRLAFLCFNNPEWRRHFFGKILDFARDTQPDGFMPDEMLWFPDQHVCGCNICRARFKKETGFDIPDPSDPKMWNNWQAPQWRAWVTARRRWLTEFVSEFRKNVIVPLGEPRLYMTCATGVSKPWRWESGIDDIEFARNGMNTHFFEAEGSPTHVRKRYAYAVYWPKYYRELKLLMAITDRFGGPVVTFGYPETLDGYDSETFFLWALCKSLGSKYFDYVPKGRGIINWERRHADLFTQNRPFADIGIVYSQTTKFLYRANEKSGIGYRHEGRVDSHLWDYAGEFSGWCETLAEGHVPFDVLLEDDMERPVLDRYKLIILPNVALMNDAWVQAIKGYVRAGGRVIATCDTSLLDETGTQRDRFALADMIGVNAPEKSGSKAINKAYGKGQCVYIREQLGLRHQSPGGYHHAKVFTDKRNPADGKRMLETVRKLRGEPGPWEIRHAPKGVIANAFRQGDRVVVHLLNALGGIRKNGDEITPQQRVSYPSVSDYNGGKDLQIILAPQNLTSATLFSPDRNTPCKLPVTRQGDKVIVQVSPSLLKRYSIIVIAP